MSGGQIQSVSLGSLLDFSFNLWSDPWIDVQRHDGAGATLSIRDCLLQAGGLAGFTDQSPLVIASLQRLLAAIIQDILQPDDITRVAELLREEQFDPAAIERFGESYAQRFDLFSETYPFLQSGDIELTPPKGANVKTVGYLFPEEPTATNINHFSHRYDDEYQFSPATAALGLITVPTFATSGGAGIKPSINGVPPLYVLPQGSTVYQTLILSLVTADYQPEIRDHDDRPVWNRDPVVERMSETLSVGYLESLTFPARRVRLFPEHAAGYDSRSGRWSDVLIRRMIFDMGISRPREASPWFDPFAAYRVSDKGVTPIRPQENKTLWREFSNLFHTTSTNEQERPVKVMSPAIVQQVAKLEERDVEGASLWRFRCIGMRTDMKAKVFEWVDNTLDVPAGLLTDELKQGTVERAIEDVDAWSRTLAWIHRNTYSDGRDNHAADRTRMLTSYWVQLTEPFRNFVQQVTTSDDDLAELDAWRQKFLSTGRQMLVDATDRAGNRSDALEKQAIALRRYGFERAKQLKKWEAE